MNMIARLKNKKKEQVDKETEFRVKEAEYKNVKSIISIVHHS